MKVSTILDQIEFGEMTLPEFQRGYVWNRNQVRGLFSSMYRKYPIGGLLIWSTDVDPSWRRDDSTSAGAVKLLLDGQQRITSLYGVMRGQAPSFFQGNESAFTDLYFDLRGETFEFYGPVKMRDDPLWISVTELYEQGVEEMLTRVADEADDFSTTIAYQSRMGRIFDIRDRDLYIDEISGRDKSIDEVVEIFNRVNSGGTKLSKGDLALARISADRPAARNELRSLLEKWEHVGYNFALDWLLRGVTSIATGQARFEGLRGVNPDTFADAIVKAEKSINFLLNLISDRLGLDHDRVLGGRYAFPVLAPLVDRHGGAITDEALQRKMLYWYVNSFMWGRYSGSTETRLQRDLEILSREGVDGLIDELRLMRTHLDVRPEDLDAWSTGARLYPVLYMMTRVGGAKDFLTGVGLSTSLLGKESALHVHHVFPKKLLYDAGYKRPQVNALGNFSFLTAASNMSIGASNPAEYLAEVDPVVLESQWIPQDRDLWAIDRFLDFLEERRKLMATAINDFLRSLVSDEGVSLVPSITPELNVAAAAYEEEIGDLARIAAVTKKLGLAVPEEEFEVVDPDSGELLAMADLAWPEGVQRGMTDPLAFLVEPDAEMEERLSELGYRFFTTEARLIWYLEELTGVDIDLDGEIGDPDGDGNRKEADVEPAPSVVEEESSASEAGAELEREWGVAMASIYRRARAEANYNAGYFLQMLSERGGLETARYLLHTPNVSEGFTHLWERGRLDLTVEAHVLQVEFEALFTLEERRIARDRMEQYGHEF